jgi:small GTP-binding protein
MLKQEKKPINPVSILVVYTSEDEKLSKRMEMHLAILIKSKIVSHCSIRVINTETDDINSKVETASIILILISSDFLASDYYQSNEMRRLFERHKANEARILPILLRPVEWERTPFTRLQIFPTNKKPITTWKRPDEAFTDVTEGIARSIEQWDGNQFSPLEDVPPTFNKVLERVAIPAPVVLCVYTDKDEALKCELSTHLEVLRLQDIISEWYAREINTEADDINSHLETASLILILISSDFLASDYYQRNEMKLLFERHNANKARLIPIILRSVEWERTPFPMLQTFPTNKKPIITWHDQDKAFSNIVNGIVGVIGQWDGSQFPPLKDAQIPFDRTVEKTTPYPPEVCCIYANADEALQHKLSTHLEVLRNQGIISNCYVREINTEIEHTSNYFISSSIFLVLISPDFLASNYSHGEEMMQLLEQHNANEARVLPILLRSANLEATSFAMLQTFPDNKKPITTWQHRDDAFYSVIKSLMRVLGQWNGSQFLPLEEVQLSLGESAKDLTIHAPEVFCIYTNTDETLQRELSKHLEILRNQGVISTYYARKVNTEIDRISSRLATASIILALISPDFLASDYHQSNEMKRIIERHEANEVRVIPILLRPADFEKTFFAPFSILPTDRYKLLKPITAWRSRDEAFHNIAQNLKEAIKYMRISSVKAAPTGLQLYHTFRDHHDYINFVAWSPDGQTLASGSDDATIKLWDGTNGLLKQTLEGHSRPINSVAWSPDGQTLASGSNDATIKLWDGTTGLLLKTLFEHSRSINSVAWSPDGQTLASGSDDATIKLWDGTTGLLLKTLFEHSRSINSVAWSPDGQTLASGSDDATIKLWDGTTGFLKQTLEGHSRPVNSVAWSPDGQTLASGSDDATIKLWDGTSGVLKVTLERHLKAIIGISFSYDSNLLASLSADDTILVWHLDSLRPVLVLHVHPSANQKFSKCLVFHNYTSTLITPGENNAILLWNLDLNKVLSAASSTIPTHYRNAKVVLVGDSGVGKSALSLVLTEQPFIATESTHGRKIWTFDSQKSGSQEEEIREIFLWDLAGQPGYRIIHQLHLNEVAVALIVFDTHSETDPFAGVQHWDRAIRLAQRIQGKNAPPLKKFLVAARIDRGGRGVSDSRIEALMHDLQFDGFFETSAKSKQNIATLAEAIKKAIVWDSLPMVSSTSLFEYIKDFLITEKKTGHTLSSIDDLYYTFLRLGHTFVGAEDLRSEFEVCIAQVESRGLIRRLSFGDLILLQPELLDAYASALVNVVKDEPDGLGSIAEERVRLGNFLISEDERLANKEQEKLLLIAMIEDLLHSELALREQAEEGSYLIFPSQSTRENTELPDPEGKTVTFDFEGPVQNIYATLAVRLSHSNFFKKKDLWMQAIAYKAIAGGICGMFLSVSNEGRGKMTVFFDTQASEETRFHFEEYIRIHLERWAIPGSIRRQRIFICDICGFVVSEQLVRLRSERGFNWANCPVCENSISFLDREERLSAQPKSRLLEMDYAADMQRDLETAKSILQGKIKTNDFDVFLCHNYKDKPAVKQIGEQLKAQGILPWLDEWELRPGLPGHRTVEEQIQHAKSAAVFVGENGIGPWEQMELEALLRQFVKRKCPVIPILLADVTEKPQLPAFLEGMTWVDFYKQVPNPMEQLIWGITGKRPFS